MSIGELERRAGIGPAHAERLAYWMQFAHLKDKAFSAAIADLKTRIAAKEKTLDRRHKITVAHNGETDHDAIIGFDPPLRTFYLQAFMGGFKEVWLGTLLEEFSSLEAIIKDARAQGYEVAGVPRETIIEMTKLAAQPHPPSIGERLGFVR
ncbi:hypothetical protein [Rhizobium wenxiniae]|uniref:hypothetical protein n=1 Tax=Rhizobium wenxiniae TaxID=1737357 RepID=UPI003C26DFE2